MKRELSEVLSEIDDPEIIEKVLNLAEHQGTTNDSQARNQDQIPISELYKRFLNRRQDRSPATVAQYKRTIPHFVDFAKQTGVRAVSGLSTQLVDRYVDTLQTEYDSDATALTYTKNVRGWLRWLNERQMCDEAVYRILDKDKLGLKPNARDEALPRSDASTIVQRLLQYRRGSHSHALVELLWNGGPRIGGVHSLDVSDFDPQERELRFRHRPETGTRLKNGNDASHTGGDGERNILLKQTTANAIQLYIETERPALTDEYSREPLFTTSYGRAARSTLRRWVYEATSCRWSREETDQVPCNGDCDPDSNVCPHSYYPHAIRRGAIVDHLSGGLRRERASERFDVSVKVIKKHYDPRTEQDRLNDRRKAVKDAWD